MALSEQDIAGIVTAERLEEFAEDIDPDIAAALARDCPKVFAENGIDTPVRIAHFFAQIKRETGGLRRLDENMNYTSVARLKAIFKRCRELSDSACEAFVRNPEALANLVYSGRNGNGDRASGDGWAFRGSGLIQLTGRGNFKAVGDEIDIDIANDPDLVRSADSCVRVAVGYWTARDINDVADGDSEAAVDRVTAKVNPHEDAGGKAERRKFFREARGIFT